MLDKQTTSDASLWLNKSAFRLLRIITINNNVESYLINNTNEPKVASYYSAQTHAEMHKFVIIAGTVSVLFRCFVLFLDLLIPVLNHKTPSQQQFDGE